jgi:hypothetical protein
MDMNHTPAQMAAAFQAAVNANRPAGPGRMSRDEAQRLVDAHLTASPYPPAGVTPDEKLLAGVCKALR